MDVLTRNQIKTNYTYYNTKNNSIEKTYFADYIFVFILLFGPKIGAYIDIKILFSLVIIIRYRKIRINKFIFGIIALIIYSGIIMLCNSTIDFVIFGRMIRSLTSMIAIQQYIYFSNKSPKRFITCLENILFIHAIIIIVSALNPDISTLFSYFSKYSKGIVKYRSTGLLIGFDIAGVITTIGLFVYLSENKKNNTVKIIRILFYIIACCLTSRVTIVLMEIALLYHIIKYKEDRKTNKFLIAIIILTIIPAAGFLLLTTEIGSPVLNFLKNNQPQIWNFIRSSVSTYAYTNVSSTIKNHFDFSSLSLIQFIFGSGKDAGGDPGYTRMIYQIGILGLSFSMSWYVLIFKDLKRKANYYWTERNNQGYLTVIQYVILLSLFLSIKNNYFFTSTVFEILMILIYSMKENIGYHSQYQ